MSLGKSGPAQSGFMDPLLESLSYITRLHGKPHSPEALRANLPLVDGKLTPTLAIRAADRVGFQARVVRRELSEITNLVLPCILILNDQQSCVLLKINDDQTVNVALPESEGNNRQISLEALQADYSQLAIYIQPKLVFEQRVDEHNQQRPISWFWGTLWTYRHNYNTVFLASILINIFTISSSLFVMNVYDRVLPNNAIETLWVLAIGISIVYVFNFILKLLRSYVIDINGKKIDAQLGSMLLQHVFSIKMRDKPVSAGAFANQMTGFESLRDLFTSATFVSLVDFPFILFFCWIIYMIGGPVVIVPLLGVCMVLITTLLLRDPARRAIEASYFGVSQKNAILVESFNGIETIKAFAAEGQFLNRWEKYTTLVAQAGLKSRFFSGLAVEIAGFIGQFVSVGVVVFGVYQVAAGELTTGGLIACTILAGRAISPITQIASIITRYQQSKLALNGLDKIMGMDSERPIGKRFLHRPNLKGKIEFDTVTFEYKQPNVSNPLQGQGTGLHVLREVSFRIKPGERVAILGKIGSGKSTILKMMLGFFDPNEGTVLIDDVDIGQIDPADLRRNIGYVSQKPMLFYGSVRDNIALGIPWATDEDIADAGKLAGVDDFVRRHPAGYDMQVGEGGEGLSGGQAQTIAIARALIASPSILLLDEPTSSMDNQAVAEFCKTIQMFPRETTIVLITHKIPMLNLVDRIIILDQGKIIADGPREEMMPKLLGKRASDTPSGEGPNSLRENI